MLPLGSLSTYGHISHLRLLYSSTLTGAPVSYAYVRI
jgi:hypothetical protein